MKILLASGNPHKLQEIQSIFSAAEASARQAGQRVPPVELVGLEPGELPEPEETGDSFEANAWIKATYYADAKQLPALADDSGLCVDPLGGLPGVRSARFARVEGERALVDAANNELLLRMLGDVEASRRVARFVCAMVLAEPGNPEPIASSRGIMSGRILGPGDPGFDLEHPVGLGENGFGYDPLFLTADHDFQKTSAELTPEQKNAISHRGKAVREMWQHIQPIAAERL